MVTCCLFIFINVICRLGGPYREKLWPTEVLKMLSEAAGQRQHFQASKNWIEFTYGDFPCHLKVNRDKLALINRLWKCKRAKDWRLPLLPRTIFPGPEFLSKQMFMQTKYWSCKSRLFKSIFKKLCLFFYSQWNHESYFQWFRGTVAFIILFVAFNIK